MARSVSMSQKDIFYLDSLAKLLGISQIGPDTNDRKWTRAAVQNLYLQYKCS